MGEQWRLWILDNDVRFAGCLQQLAEREGYRVHLARVHREILVVPAELRTAAAIIEPRLSDGFSLEFLRHLKCCGGGPAVIVTQYPSVAAAVKCMKLGAIDYIPKPVDARHVLRMLPLASHDASIKPDGDAPLREQDDVPSLDRIQYEHMWRVVVECGGNISEAARRLRRHRQSLSRMLQRYPPP